MKKILLPLCFLSIMLVVAGCHHDRDHVRAGGVTITNVHAPTSGADSIKFTADTSNLHILLYCPLGGSNHVVIHDMTTGNDLYNGSVTTVEQSFTGFIAGDSYAVICYSGEGTDNFGHVSSSFRNSGTI